MGYVFKSILSFSFIIIYFCHVNAVDFVNCGSHWSIEGISVENCLETDEFCSLPMNSSVQVSYTLNTGKGHGKFDIEGDLINDVSAVLGGGTKFALFTTPINLCDVILCPLSVNYKATYSGLIFINITVPVSGTIEWIVHTADDASDQLMCFQFPIQISK